MLILIITLLIVFFVFSFRKDKLSPNTIFIGLWAVVITLYNFHQFGIYDISKATYEILILGIVFFEIGYLFDENIIVTKRHSIRNSCLDYQSQSCQISKTERQINIGLMNILIFIIFVCSIPTGITRMSYLINSGFEVGAVKNALIIGILPSGTILDTFIVSPLTPLITFVSTYFLFNHPEHKLIVFSGVYITIYHYLTSGARLSLLYYIVALLLNMRISGNGFGSIPKKIKKWIIRLVIPLLIFLVYAMIRNTDNGLKNIYYYLCGCMPMLDHVVSEQSGYFDLGRTYGTLSLYGIINPFFQLVSKLGLDKLSYFCDTAELYLANIEKTNYAGTNQLYNAFVTYVATFYIDFGKIGVIAFSFIFGFFSSHYYKLYKKGNSIFDALPVGIVYFLIVTSIIKIGFTGYRSGLGFIYILILRRFLFSSESVKKQKRN